MDLASEMEASKGFTSPHLLTFSPGIILRTQTGESPSEGGSTPEDRRYSHVAPELNRIIAKVITDTTHFRHGNLDTLSLA